VPVRGAEGGREYTPEYTSIQRTEVAVRSQLPLKTTILALDEYIRREPIKRSDWKTAPC